MILNCTRFRFPVGVVVKPGLAFLSSQSRRYGFLTGC